MYKGKIVAFSLSCVDIEAQYFFAASEKIFCKACDSCLDESYIPRNLVISSKYDIGCTYDGRYIVSSRFKEFCAENYPNNLTFESVTIGNDYFLASPMDVLRFDVLKRKTSFRDLCQACGNYTHITGATPAFLMSQEAPISHGIYRTDIVFGSGRSKSALIIVGTETKREIIVNKLTGATFLPAYGS